MNKKKEDRLHHTLEATGQSICECDRERVTYINICVKVEKIKMSPERDWSKAFINFILHICVFMCLYWWKRLKKGISTMTWNGKMKNDFSVWP